MLSFGSQERWLGGAQEFRTGVLNLHAFAWLVVAEGEESSFFFFFFFFYEKGRLFLPFQEFLFQFFLVRK